MSGPVSSVDAPATDDGTLVAPPSSFERFQSRVADVGGMPVRRALPKREKGTIGAWCFVDHFGSGSPPTNPTMGIGPHPHMGLQTVTWLVEGEVLHRDSLGSEQVIRSGQLNLMTAGRGVAHAEETPIDDGAAQRGAQLWVALPEATRHGEPAFEHHDELAQLEVGGLKATVMVGSVEGVASPARADTALVGIALGGRRRRRDHPIDPSFEHGLVVLAGALMLGDERVEPGELAYLGVGRDELVLSTPGAVHALVLGGNPFPDHLLMWWNFVARTWEEVEPTRSDWEAEAERFGEVNSALGRIAAPPVRQTQPDRVQLTRRGVDSGYDRHSRARTADAGRDVRLWRV